MFKVLILICSLDIAAADCRPDIARAVFQGPEVANEILCGLHGQAFLANTSLIAKDAGEFVKIICRRADSETVLQEVSP